MISKNSTNPSSFVSEGWPWCTTITPVATITVASLTIFWYYQFIKKFSKNLPPLPPGPKGLPLVGNLLSIEPELHLYFAKLSKNYGPIFKLQLCSKTCIVISSNLLARQVLKDHDAIFANRDPVAAGLASAYGGLDIAWRPNSHGWRKLRKLFVREVMSKANLDACYMLRQQEVQKTVTELLEKVGSPVNVGEQVFVTVQNVILTMLWGEGLHGAELRQVVEEMVQLIGMPNISDLFPVLASLDLQGIVYKMNKLIQWFDKIFESMMAHRNRVDRTKSKDLFQVLLNLMKQNDDTKSISTTELKALLMDIVVAGTDTTSTVLEWAMAEILKHPEVMAKVHQELEIVVGNDKIVEDSHLPDLVFLGAVIKETLRLHPAFPLLIPHSPSESCTIGGYTIPKGSRVLFNVWQMHRDAKAWNEPLKFQPERFLKEPGRGDFQGNDFNFLPFGSGRRICAGIPLAERMLTYVLATLLHSFDWKLEEGAEHDLTEKFGIVLKKRTPLICIPTLANQYT